MRDEPVKLMTVNQRLIQALCPLRLPVEPEVDTRYQSRCITFNYDLLPVQFADNRPILHKALIQVHLFLPLTENSQDSVGGSAGAGGRRFRLAGNHGRQRQRGAALCL